MESAVFIGDALMARIVALPTEVNDLSGLCISGVNAAELRQGCLILP